MAVRLNRYVRDDSADEAEKDAKGDSLVMIDCV